MHKPLYNVLEFVAISDPNNFFTNDYRLDNFDKYNFKSLHQFNKRVVIDPETGRVYPSKSTE
jgi:hypothetical protein